MREYLLVLLIAAAVTYLSSALCRRLAFRVGALAKVRDRDVHTVEMPYFGGVAMLAGVGAAILLSWQLPFLGSQPTVLQDSRAVLVSAAVIGLVGVLDDVFDLPPLAKFSGQVLAAGIAVALGVKMLWIPLPDQIVSLNASTSVAIAGACLGFLPHNFFPARMFMGDSGSMLLGLLLATSTISLTGQIDNSQLDSTSGFLPTILPLVLPLAILALPFLDLTLAFVRRTYAGKWWFLPDKQHLHHRLLERGHSQRRAVLLMYVWSALVSFGVIVLGLVRGDRQWTVVAVVAVLALVLLGVTLGRPVRNGSPPRPGESLS